MGTKVREKREEKRLTQQELADKSGLSRVTIGEIESGKRVNINARTMLKIADALETTAHALFFAEDDN